MKKTPKFVSPFAFLCLFLFFGCSGIITNTLNPPQQSDMEKQILKMHKDLMAFQQLEMDTVGIFFKLSWEPVDSIDGYRIYRSESTEAQFSAIGSTNDTFYIDNTAAPGIRYRYQIVALRGATESEPSNVTSGAWVDVGSPFVTKEWRLYYDTLWTTSDMLLVRVPNHQPCEVQWIKEPTEAVKWTGFFDADTSGFVDLSDLIYFGANYQKEAKDSVGIR